MDLPTFTQTQAVQRVPLFSKGLPFSYADGPRSGVGLESVSVPFLPECIAVALVVGQGRLLIPSDVLFCGWSEGAEPLTLSVQFVFAETAAQLPPQSHRAEAIRNHLAWSVDPDDADVAEENALFVFLILTRAAFLSTMSRVLCQGDHLCTGARDSTAFTLMLVNQHKHRPQDPKVSEVHFVPGW